MGSVGVDPDHVNVRFTQEFADAQRDERFQGWLRWRRIGHDIGFDDFDVSDIVYMGQDFTRDGLSEVETRLLEHFPKEKWNVRALRDDQEFNTAMQVAWYVGQVYVENLEGVWVSFPRPDISPTAGKPLVDLPDDNIGFFDPVRQVMNAISRRTGDQWTKVYDTQERKYQKWVSEGRPKRVFSGLVPTEDDIPDPRPKYVDQKAIKKMIAEAEKERKAAAKQKPAEDMAPQATLSGPSGSGAGAAAASSAPKPKPAPPVQEEEEWEPPATWLERP